MYDIYSIKFLADHSISDAHIILFIAVIYNPRLMKRDSFVTISLGLTPIQRKSIALSKKRKINSVVILCGRLFGPFRNCGSRGQCVRTSRSRGTCQRREPLEESSSVLGMTEII